MRVKHSVNFPSEVASADFQKYLGSITETELINLVEDIAIPRHFRFNAKNNKFIAEYIAAQLTEFGYDVEFQGEFANVLAFNPNIKSSSVILVCAHYDSVPGCPGADDNASAVAALISCAKSVSRFAPDAQVCFAAFNCEEDGLVGSRDFVANYLVESELKIKLVHNLEMVGYATEEANSQKLPPLLPIKVPTTGNFLGILGNRDSLNAVDRILAAGKTYLPEFPVIGLKLYLGAEKLIPDLGRSDHFPFWEKRLPALMWTDTSEFRNPHYHKLSDTPETLNYTFLKRVTQLLFLQILNSTKDFES